MTHLKILFVCMGNICRSPTADGVMKYKLDKRGLTQFISVDSVGTHAYHVGEAPDKRSIAEARINGVDLSTLRSRQLENRDYLTFDYILAMDADNLELIHQRKPADSKAEIGLFLEYAMREGSLGAKPTQVPDPYYGGSSGFSDVFAMIDVGCDALISHLHKHYPGLSET